RAFRANTFRRVSMPSIGCGYYIGPPYVGGPGGDAIVCASSARWASAYKIMMRHIYITANRTLSFEERNVMCACVSSKTRNPVRNVPREEPNDLRSRAASHSQTYLAGRPFE